MVRRACRLRQTIVCYLRIKTRSFAYILLVFFAALATGVFIPKSAGYLWVVHPFSRLDAAWFALSSATGAMFFLALAGFCFLRGILSLDQRYRTDQLLDSSLTSYGQYVWGRFFGGVLVLLSAWLILMLGTLAVCLLKFGASFRPLDYLLSFAAFLPNIVLVTAVTVLFDAVPPLRGGLGVILYFALWIFSIAFGISGGTGGLNLSIDLSGITTLTAILLDTYPDEYRIGMQWITELPGAVSAPGAGFAFASLLSYAKLGALVLSALLLCLAAWCRKTMALRKARKPRFARLRGWLAQPTRLGPAGGRGALPLWTARLLIGQMPVIWSLAALVLMILLWVLPMPFVSGLFLSIVLLWPALLFSQLGCHGRLAGVDSLTAASSRSARLPFMDLPAGIFIALTLTCGFAVRLVLARQWAVLASYAAGMLFIPSLAFLLGRLTQSERPFQVAYLLLWYIGPFSDVPALNYILTAPERVAAGHTCFYLIASLAMWAVLLVTDKRRRAN